VIESVKIYQPSAEANAGGFDPSNTEWGLAMQVRISSEKGPLKIRTLVL